MGVLRVVVPCATEFLRHRRPALQPGHGPRRRAKRPAADGMLEVAAAVGMRWQPGHTVSRRSVRGIRPLDGGGR